MDKIAHRLFEVQNDTPDYFYSHRYVTHGTQLHFHRNSELFCVFDGRVEITVNDRTFDLSDGMAAFIDGLQIHSYKCTSAEISYTIFGTDFLQPFRSLYRNGKIPTLLTDTNANKPIFDYVTRISMQVADFTDLEKYAHTYSLLAMIVKRYGTEKAEQKTSDSSTVSNIFQYIYDNYTQDLSLTSIAEHFHFHPQSLSNLLRKYINTDLRTYINNLRVQEMIKLKQMPENKDKSVIDLAMQCGFNSSTTFYRAYNKFMESYYPHMRNGDESDT